MTERPDNMVVLDVLTKQDIPVDRVLDGAKNLKRCVVLGVDENGEEYFASSYAEEAEILWLLVRAQQTLLEMANKDRSPRRASGEGTLLPFPKRPDPTPQTEGA